MNNTKFRVWDKNTNTMHYLADSMMSMINLQMNNSQWAIFEGNFRICGSVDDSGILEQFTGLYDRAGRGIYEGDIIDVSEFKEGNPKVTVFWCDLKSKFMVATPFICGGPIGRDLYYWVKRYGNTSKCEVIGNIHEKGDPNA